MKKSLALLACGLAVICALSPAYAGRVDLNGELVSDNYASGSITGDVPYNWSYFTVNGGGGLGSRYSTGSSSSAYTLQFENEGVLTSYPGGHSVIFGQGTNAGAQHGILQTASSTAGKLYWLTGGQTAAADWSTNQKNQYYFRWGIDNGNSTAGGLTSYGNIRPTTSMTLNGGGRFSYAMVASGSQITAHVGLDSRVTSPVDINVYVDGLRLYEMDISVNSSLQNGGFESAATNISNYAAMGGTVQSQSFLIPDWLPLGGSAAQMTSTQPEMAVANVGAGAQSLYLEQWKGVGRMFMFQRINSGNGLYTLSGLIRADSADSKAMIGIDPNGGLDPNAASVVWSALLGAYGSYQPVAIPTVTSLGGNGVTVFLAAGYTGGERSGAFSGARFDSINVAFVPEPGSLFALGAGMLGLLGGIRRRK